MSLAIQSRSSEIWEECLEKDVGLPASIYAGVALRVHTLWKFLVRESRRKGSLTCSTEGTKPTQHLYRGSRVMELHMLLTQSG